MKQIKTFTGISTTETEVQFDAYYPFVWIENQGESDCYVANYSGFSAQDVDVTIIKAGNAKRIDAKSNTVYTKTASGTTTIEAHGQNNVVSPFKVQPKGGDVPSDLGALAYKDTATGTAVTTVGTLPSLTYDSTTESFTFSAGTLPTTGTVTVS